MIHEALRRKYNVNDKYMQNLRRRDINQEAIIFDESIERNFKVKAPCTYVSKDLKDE